MAAEFSPGDEVMLVCPAGAPPFPDGPVRVIACVAYYAEIDTAEYVVEHSDGRRESVEELEMMHLDHWVEYMKQHAN